MDVLIYFLIAFSYLILFTRVIQTVKRVGWSTGPISLMLVILALIYDNGILAIGRYIGQSELLQTLNLARFWLHALFTPTLVLFCWDLLRRMNIRWVNKQWGIYVFFIITFSLVILEIVTEVLGVSLKGSWEYGVLSYENTNSSSGPPLMILIVTAILTITSMIIWRKLNWIWFLIACILMICGSAFKFPINSNTIQNLLELTLILSLLGTWHRLENSAFIKGIF